jgi:iron complex transport system substrate-binding protein
LPEQGAWRLPGAGKLNALGALAAVTLATLAAIGTLPSAPPRPALAQVVSAVEPEQLPGGGRALRDQSGRELVLRDFQRIASTAAVADPVLRELCDDRHIVAFSSHSREVGPDAHQYAHKPGAELTRTEALIKLKPDLVLVSSLGDHAHTERLRDAGLTVFDLGKLTGVDSLLDTILRLGWIVGAPERARSFAAHFVQRLNAVAADVSRDARQRALYVGVYGTQLFGGSTGTSYHDVLTHAGLLDAAAERFTGWPSYTPEQLLTLAPAVVVTQTGGGTLLCRHTELRLLAACATGRIVEVDEALLNDAGVHMLDAAELVRAAVHGPGRPP